MAKKDIDELSNLIDNFVKSTPEDRAKDVREYINKHRPKGSDPDFQL